MNVLDCDATKWQVVEALEVRELEKLVSARNAK